MMHSGPPSCTRRRLLHAAIALMLAGCGGRPARRADESEALRGFSERGYLAAKPHAYDTLTENSPIDGEAVAIQLLMPHGQTHLPLVLYLPGLGETAAAGLQWRQAWVGAGYAVVSLSLPADAMAWSSEAARRGDFGAIARERSGAAALSQRILLARRVIDSLERRKHLPPYDAIDTQRIALAGFDLGAQAVNAFAGEHTPGLTAAATEALALPALRAIIAINPASGSARDASHEHDGAMLHAVLLIAGEENSALPGGSHTLSRQRARYHGLPAGDKYLLVLAHGGHRTLSGSPPAPTDTPSNSRGNRERAAGPPAGGGMGGGMGDGGRGAPPPGAHAGLLRTEANRDAVIVAQVTVAFLDATLKGDTVAHEWLSRDTQRWIGDQGEWQRK